MYFSAAAAAGAEPPALAAGVPLAPPATGEALPLPAALGTAELAAPAEATATDAAAAEGAAAEGAAPAAEAAGTEEAGLLGTAVAVLAPPQAASSKTSILSTPIAAPYRLIMDHTIVMPSSPIPAAPSRRWYQ